MLSWHEYWKLVNKNINTKLKETCILVQGKVNEILEARC